MKTELNKLRSAIKELNQSVRDLRPSWIAVVVSIVRKELPKKEG